MNKNSILLFVKKLQCIWDERIFSYFDWYSCFHKRLELYLRENLWKSLNKDSLSNIW
jgi:hypothetical protein